MQSPYIVEVNQHNFREVFERSVETPILFYFWAPMNQESVQLIPELQSVAQQHSGAFTLALLNCQQEQQVAAQFGVQTLPTIALFINGQAVDGLAGAQTIETVNTMLSKHLPSHDEVALQQALTLIEQTQHSQALPLLLSLPDDMKAKAEVKLALADVFLETQQYEAAETELDRIPLEYQDGYYKGLIAKLELHKQAADSPEIQALEEIFSAEPNNAHIASELALQYHQVNRNEEALELLWSFLQSDLNCLDGGLKKVFMDILSALGQGNSVANLYRRKLYSLLY
ncbi:MULTISPECIES: thioredoxin family protein [unclassified Vibrio]|uniref:thioredoxin family protein n=1 Tax=unclassified Vibrio TaxID=2614977 RepID=UPI000B8E4229|nr:MULTISPECIES: co-chaperone YbbN [unclassified Vibrio]NAX45338.1 tetratricopeptide repeat protein [Vibrio sp. V25_P4S6T154]OXX45842.1 co-chaperone YbbN [Vibrio sp. V17_P4S1T151]OXX58983.1 co-chaperone YbbN [Vibrio sp. V15_P4S5T153]OXX65654.1 co-chaperone YbbN [Vibrio sp. V20_P4S3T152]